LGAKWEHVRSRIGSAFAKATMGPSRRFTLYILESSAEACSIRLLLFGVHLHPLFFSLFLLGLRDDLSAGTDYKDQASNPVYTSNPHLSQWFKCKCSTQAHMWIRLNPRLESPSLCLAFSALPEVNNNKWYVTSLRPLISFPVESPPHY